MLHEIRELSLEETAVVEGKPMRMLLAGYLAKQAPGMDSSDDSSFDKRSSGESPSCDGSCRDPLSGCKPPDAAPEELSDASLKSCLFFDIETTGLSASTSFIFLIGCISFENGKWILHQFFIRMVQEEKQLLSSFFELTAKK